MKRFRMRIFPGLEVPPQRDQMLELSANPGLEPRGIDRLKGIWL
jgi:hypothetical protein